MSRSPRNGRPPKPHKLRVIEGNPSGRPIPEPPKVAPSKPYCPSWLRQYAKTEWKRIAGHLDELGLLTQVDRSTLAAYCEAVATLKEATEAIDRHGILVEGRRGGELVKNPALQVQRDAMRMVSTYSAMFGLSPSDRMRLVGDAGGHAADLDELLAR